MSDFSKPPSGLSEIVTLATRVGEIPIYSIERSGALDEWALRAAAFGETGLWPLLLGPVDNLGELDIFENFADAFEVSAGDVLLEAAEVNVTEFFGDALTQMEEDAEEEDDFAVDLEIDISALSLDQVGAQTPSVVNGTSEEGAAYVALAELPCAEPWQIFAIRPFGGWNAVPSDAELTAVLKSWYTRFGAVPVGITFDVVELYVNNPITDPAIAAEVALEMYAFCPDIVDQGVGSVQDLAQELLNARSWFFWWD